MNESKQEFFLFLAGIAGVVSVILGIGAEIAWSNHDTNIRYNVCEKAAAAAHMHANCPAHLISPRRHRMANRREQLT